jgi:hypothetical protein
MRLGRLIDFHTARSDPDGGANVVVTRMQPMEDLLGEGIVTQRWYSFTPPRLPDWRCCWRRSASMAWSRIQFRVSGARSAFAARSVRARPILCAQFLTEAVLISIVGGLIFSQMLTLYTTPVMYLYLDRLRLWFKGKGRGHDRRTLALLVMVAGALTLLASCKVGPNYVRPAAEIPAAYKETGQPVLIPGDMGRYSFVLVGTRSAFLETWGSTCHGAGRKMSRAAAKRFARGRRIHKELADRGIVLEAEGEADFNLIYERIRNRGLAISDKTFRTWNVLNKTFQIHFMRLLTFHLYLKCRLLGRLVSYLNLLNSSSQCRNHREFETIYPGFVSSAGHPT